MSGRIMKYHIEIQHLLCWRLLRPTDIVFLKNGCGTQKFPISAFQNHLQTKFNLHIFIHQSQFISAISIRDTLKNDHFNSAVQKTIPKSYLLQVLVYQHHVQKKCIEPSHNYHLGYFATSCGDWSNKKHEKNKTLP